MFRSNSNSISYDVMSYKIFSKYDTMARVNGGEVYNGYTINLYYDVHFRGKKRKKMCRKGVNLKKFLRQTLANLYITIVRENCLFF